MSESPPPGNLPEFTVSEISRAVKMTLETRFERVRVRGEISGFKRHSSGHLYFNLKDEEAVLAAVCWRGTAGKLGLNPEDGMEIVASGRITGYGARSNYQIVVDRVELAGQGALLKLLEDRRKKLAAEGLFDAERKKKLPMLPAVIGIVTSPTGAVIRDILHRLADRFPRPVLLWPVAVQGEGAAEQIAAAIAGFNALKPGGTVPRPELLIVARGGGSLEDLWAFNEEIVVRAAAASAIPLISAVGHETDTTLIDYAADLRAPTPTAAAELAVPVRAELLAELAERGHRLAQSVARLFGHWRTEIEGLGRGLPDPRRILEEKAQALDSWQERLVNARGGYFAGRYRDLAALAGQLGRPDALLARKRDQLAHGAALFAKAVQGLGQQKERALERAVAGLRPQAILELIRRQQATLAGIGQLLESLSYQSVLSRGFVLVRDTAGQALTSAAAIAPGSPLRLAFHDGEIGATADGEAPPRSVARRSRGGGEGEQGSLL